MSVGGSDLGALLLWLAAGLIAIGAIGVIAFVLAKRSGSPSPALSITRSLAFAWLAISALIVPLAIYVTLIAPTVMIPDAEIPVTGTPSPCDIDDPSVACAWSAGAGGEFPGLAVGIRVLLLLGRLLQIAVFAAPAAALFVLARDALAGTPFTRAVVRTVTAVAIAVAAGGILSHLLLDISGALAVRDAAADLGLDAPPTFALSLPLWPLAAGVGIAGLAAVFRHGERLQRDTEGLV
ncbi:hypothetical protein [Microbacterium sp. gxy059]|uniref:hypothetical protein n=1 Tax=Microbacterium sp. gxy059 TaxID=2957199 RepID=UPI003D993622